MLNGSTDITNSGIAPFEYEVRIGDAAFMAGPRQLIDLNSITMGYSIDDNRAYFGTWDADSVRGRTADLPPDVLPVPRNGDNVVITAVDGMSQLRKIIFSGKIDAVSEHITAEGRRYGCTASSNFQRINEYRITASFNPLNDPVRPQPVFDPETGTLIDAKSKTVAQIVREIMRFPDAWNTEPYFTYADINWNGLENSPICGAFVPTNVSFVDTPKGDAIREVLQKAGSFELYYDPESDKLYVVQLNLACDRCGDLWNIRFVEPNTQTGQGYDYAYNLQVISDNTEWTSRQSANVCRVTSGPIRFYSGDFIVPEMVENAVTTQVQNEDGTWKEVEVPVPENQRLRQVGQDTVAQQKQRAKNQEGVYYRFQPPVARVLQDSRKYLQYPIGMPLFPDWNPHADYLPDLVTICGVTPPSTGFVNGLNEAAYLQRTEWQGITRGHHIMMGARRLGYHDHLRMYQAWYAKDPCPCCGGSGSVKRVYSGAENKPELEWRQVGPGQAFEAFIVKNYLFKPEDFGNPAAYVAPQLEPWEPTPQEPYPVPWKHLCPGCRGVGLKPEYKIRNIQPTLVRTRAPQRKDKKDGNDAVLLDPEWTQVEPESWEQSQNRLTFNAGPYVQVEEVVTTKHRLPGPLDRTDGMPITPAHSWTWSQLRRFKPTSWSIQTPLDFYSKRLADLVGLPSDSPDRKLTSSLKSPKVNACFTTITFGHKEVSLDQPLGRVEFAQPVGIQAEAHFALLNQVPSDGDLKYLLSDNGLINDRPTNGGDAQEDESGIPYGYFRPARVWMQFFYIKEGFYKRYDNAVEFNYTNADGETHKYLARGMIVDGRWCCEVVKKKPSEWGGEEVEFGNRDRVVQVAITDSNAVIETTEQDLETMFIPGIADLDPEAYEQYKTDQGVQFTRGRLFRWDMPTAGESAAEVEGVPSELYFNMGLLRPRLYTWRLRDDRPKLLAMAVRKLENANDIRVSGSLTIRGMTHTTAGGLGYIEYPGKAKAAVVKVTHNFGRGYSTMLEVTRKEARAGDLPPDDEVTLADLQKELREFKDGEQRLKLAEAANQRRQRATADQSSVGTRRKV